MAKRREIICDRCEMVIASLNLRSTNIVKRNSTKIKWWKIGSNRIYPGQRIDLCADCANKLEEFIKGEINDVTEARDNM